MFPSLKGGDIVSLDMRLAAAVLRQSCLGSIVGRGGVGSCMWVQGLMFTGKTKSYLLNLVIVRLKRH